MARRLYRKHRGAFPETDHDFYNTLRDRCQDRRPLFEPDRERRSLQELVKELFPEPEKG